MLCVVHINIKYSCAYTFRVEYKNIFTIEEENKEDETRRQSIPKVKQKQKEKCKKEMSKHQQN